MDKRLKLTAKQKELVKDLEKAFAALAKEHVIWMQLPRQNPT